MSNKAHTLARQLGPGLADSIGAREGESMVPTARPDNIAAPPANFTRSRSAGEIDIDEVMPDPGQPREYFDEEQLCQLGQDIKERGQLQPIRVRWFAPEKKWLIIAGERRWRSMKAAGIARISCVFVEHELSESAIRSEQLVENLLREDLSPIEQANGFKSLIDLNKWTVTELAARIHVSKASVSRAMALLKLPEDLQEKVEDGSLSPTTAYQVAKVKDADKQREIADRAVAGQIGSVGAEEASRRSKGDSPRRSTNESYSSAAGVKIVVTARKQVGDDVLLDALLEMAETVRRRMKSARAKVA